MDFTNYDRHDGVADYIEHVLRLVDEAEYLVGQSPFEWLRLVLTAEQKYHRQECERIIARMENEF